MSTPPPIPPRPRSKVKLAMLVVTIAWPAISLLVALYQYNESLSGKVLPEYMSRASGHVATIAVTFGMTFVVLLPVWLIAIAILGVVYFATRR